MSLKLPFEIGFDAGPEGLADALTDAEGKILATADDWDLEDLSEIAESVNDRDRLAAELAAKEAERDGLASDLHRLKLHAAYLFDENRNLKAECERLRGELAAVREECENQRTLVEAIEPERWSLWQDKCRLAASLAAKEAEVERLTIALDDIHSRAHDFSSGPAVPDGYWEIRGVADAALAPSPGEGGGA
jgi:chromosome segregation ATPase